MIALVVLPLTAILRALFLTCVWNDGASLRLDDETVTPRPDVTLVY